MIEELVHALNTEAAGEALSVLYSIAKTKAGKDQIESELKDHAILHSLVTHESAKVRKNVYRLIGALGNASDINALEKALQEEKTLFAVPSLLLALGNLGAEDVLLGYVPPVSDNADMDKHIAAITSAHQKALHKGERADAERIYQLPFPRVF